MKRGDTYPPLAINLTYIDDNNVSQPTDLRDSTVKIIIKTASFAIVLSGVTLFDGQNGKISYSWQAGDTDFSGTYDVEVEVNWPGGYQTFPNDSYGTLIIMPDLGGDA